MANAITDEGLLDWMMEAMAGVEETGGVKIVGRISLGYKDQNGQMVRTKHFCCSGESSGLAFREQYGKEPICLPIRLFSRDYHDVFSVKLEMYGASAGLKCSCSSSFEDIKSGKGICYRLGADNRMHQGKCGGVKCEDFREKACKPVGRLRFILEEVPIFGIWEFSSAGKHSITNIKKSLNLIYNPGFKGDPTSVVFDLIAKQQEAHPEYGGSKKKTTINVADLIIRVSLKQLMSGTQASPLVLCGMDMTKQIESGNIKADESTSEVPKDLFPEAFAEPIPTDFSDAEPAKMEIIEDGPAPDGDDLDKLLGSDEEPLISIEEAKALTKIISEYKKTLIPSDMRDLTQDLSAFTKHKSIKDIPASSVSGIKTILDKYAKKIKK